MPPDPALEEKIVRTKKRVLAGQAIPAAGQYDVDVLDLRTFTLITNRPNRTRAHTLVSPTREFAPVTGGRKALVLLVDFSDKAATQSQTHYNDMLFSVGSYATGSMRDFYREASYGKLDVTGEVSGTGGPTAGWYRAPKPKTYYTNNENGFGSYPKNAQKLAEDAIDLAAPHVNFANYDNDGDGFVEALVIICAGSGAEQTGNANDIWSHKWGISPKTVDGVKVDRYFMAPEDGRVGVMSHELGHLLMGWPDLYDTDYSSRGTGKWDLMAGGSWNGSPAGDKPAHPTAWCKVKVGWVTPTTVFDAEQDITLAPYADNAQVYKLPIGSTSSKEYFLLSNRKKTKFDSGLPGEGCIIEHVDDDQTNNTDETHYLVDIEQADGKQDLNKNANSGDAGDPYPSGANNQFTASSNPNSKSYAGASSKVEVTNIAHAGINITAHVKVGEVTNGGGAQWKTNVDVTATYATVNSKNAWAIIDTVAGWRQIKDISPDGVTNTFNALCEAKANNRKVHVYLDDTSIYRVILL
jgi:immune inhibitor A